MPSCILHLSSPTIEDLSHKGYVKFSQQFCFTTFIYTAFWVEFNLIYLPEGNGTIEHSKISKITDEPVGEIFRSRNMANSLFYDGVDTVLNQETSASRLPFCGLCEGRRGATW